MTYPVGDWAVNVVGSLPGSENWANRWTIRDTSGTAQLDDARDAFHDFYESVAGLWFVSTHATSISFRGLNAGTVYQPTWADINGEVSSGAPLPTECALRISLSAANNRHGGPFLAGFSGNFNDTQGRLDDANAPALQGAVQALYDDLAAADWQLRLDSPTDVTTHELTAIRVGRVYDVIRKRRNKISEGFLAITL